MGGFFLGVLFGIIIGAIVAYFVARNNQKHLDEAFNVDDRIRAEFEQLKKKAQAKAFELKQAARNL